MTMHPLRKLLVLGLNEIVARNLVSLDPVEGERGFLLEELAGRPSLMTWHDAGFGELMLAVWWDYDKHHDPNFDRYGRQETGLIQDGIIQKRVFLPPTNLLFAQSRKPRVIGAAVTGWLERKTARHLQGKGPQRLVSTYLRTGSRALLDAVPDPVPLGFAVSGKFFL